MEGIAWNQRMFDLRGSYTGPKISSFMIYKKMSVNHGKYAKIALQEDGRTDESALAFMFGDTLVNIVG